LLPPPFSVFVEDVADRMQVPPDFSAIPVLIAAATMVGREFRLAPKLHDNWEERACLWGMVIGDPGANKTAPMAHAMRPVTKMQGEMWEHWTAEHAAWVRRKQTKEDDLGPEPRLETVYTSETTVEALVPNLSPEGNANPRGVVLYRDELSGWFGAMNKYRQRGGDDRPFFLQCWSGGAFRVDRKSTGTLFVSDLYLSIVGTIQPGVVQAVLRDGDVDGMTARFQLMVWPLLPERVDVVDRRPDFDAINAVEARLRSIRVATPLDGCRVLRFSGEAYAIFNKWLLANQNRPEVRSGEGFAAHLAKYPGLFARLALTLHLMRHGAGAPAEVGVETADAVREIIDKYLEPHAQRVYGLLSAQPARAGAVRIARWVRERRIDSFTARDVSKNNWREFSAEKDDRPVIEAALRYLEMYDWVQLIDKPTGARGGRPTVEALVNPAVHRGVSPGFRRSNAGAVPPPESEAAQ